MSVFTEFLHEVERGKRYRINLKEKTIKINGNELLLTDDLIDVYDTVELGLTEEISDFWNTVETLYAKYKKSVPGAHSKGNRPYFHGENVEDLTDDELAFNEPRNYMQAALEGYVLLSALNGDIEWPNEEHWFWQSPVEKDLVILREWI